jgi:hypothetical protein
MHKQPLHGINCAEHFCTEQEESIILFTDDEDDKENLAVN